MVSRWPISPDALSHRSSQRRSPVSQAGSAGQEGEVMGLGLVGLVGLLDSSPALVLMS